MDMQLLCNKFQRIGARVRIVEKPIRGPIEVDIGHDHKGEFFDLSVRRDSRVELDAIDVRPDLRHLLLMARDDEGRAADDNSGGKRKFLCGHDERAWFVAAVPEQRAASNVRTAMEALKPRDVIESQARHAVRFDKRNRRHNDGFVRQGEWFFIPMLGVHVSPGDILRNEPLQRTGGKPHRVEFLFRTGGEVVYVDARAKRVLSASQYQRLVRTNPGAARGWTLQRQNMQVLVKGRVSHPDHKTITLRDWHRVAMNTENQSIAIRYVQFID